MGDDDAGFSIQDLPEAIPNPLLRLGINGGEGIVQNHNLWVQENGPSDSDALLLPAGKRCPLLPNQRFNAHGKGLDVLIDL